jgi:hypothetical protein
MTDTIEITTRAGDQVRAWRLQDFAGDLTDYWGLARLCDCCGLMQWVGWFSSRRNVLLAAELILFPVETEERSNGK